MGALKVIVIIIIIIIIVIIIIIIIVIITIVIIILYLTITLRARVFCEQIVNEAQPSWLSLVQNEGEWSNWIYRSLIA